MEIEDEREMQKNNNNNNKNKQRKKREQGGTEARVKGSELNDFVVHLS